MLRILQHLLGGPLFNDLAVAHHGDPVREAGHHRQVVADHEHAHGTGLQPIQQAHHLRSHRGVECRRRFVRDEESRARGDRRGDQRPLPEAAGQLMRILQGPQPGLGHTHFCEQLEDACLPGSLSEVGVEFQRFAHFVTDASQ